MERESSAAPKVRTRIVIELVEKLHCPSYGIPGDDNGNDCQYTMEFHLAMPEDKRNRSPAQSGKNSFLPDFFFRDNPYVTSLFANLYAI